MIKEETRKLGFDAINECRWGTHLCQFYQTKEDLVDILVPYFKAGLQNNEFCMWVTSEPLRVEDATAALGKAVKNLDIYIAKGQIEILDASQWYTKSGRFEPDEVLQGWVEKEKQALERGFDGLRLTGNTYWLEEGEWGDFADYEAVVDNVIGNHRMIALCSYCLDKCGAYEVIDVLSNHGWIIIKRKDKWETIAIAGCDRLEHELLVSHGRHEDLANTLPQIVFEIDERGDFIYANTRAFEISGYTREDFDKGLNALQILAPEDRHRVADNMRQILSGVPSNGNEYMALRKDGSTFPVRVYSRPLLADDKPVGLRGVAIDITKDKQAEEALERRNKELSALNRIAQLMSQSMNLEDILQSALDGVLEVIDMPVGTIILVNENTKVMSCAVHGGLSEEMAELFNTEPILDVMSFWKKVASQGKVLITDNVSKEVEPSYKFIVEREEIQSAAGIPLKSKDKTLGVMVICSHDDRTFSPEEIRLMETIGNQIGVAIDNAQLFEKISEQSLTDELTGLYNRRYFYKVLETEISRSQRFGYSFSMVMLDLDGFKEYNDKLGHINGDAVLKSLAQTLVSGLRKTDTAFRYGGDEFVTILPQTDAERARRIIDRIRKKWLKVSEEKHTFLENHLGFSAGVAQFPENAETADGLVFLSDSALYHSKRLGGHMSTLASELGGISTGVLATTILDQVYALSAMVDARDPYTYGHSKRVAAISEKIGRNLGLSNGELANLHAASLLHDIGKVGIPDSILSKAGKLTRSEWRLMKRHPIEGAKIAGHVNDLSEVLPAILHHHEWYNGKGYPNGLKDEDIPIAARIISVADAYDTMTTPRTYNEIKSHKEACDELRRCSGTQFDPEVVEALCKETDILLEPVPG